MIVASPPTVGMRGLRNGRHARSEAGMMKEETAIVPLRHLAEAVLQVPSLPLRERKRFLRLSATGAKR
ncbi:hypothetical protein FP2506_05836 [Fulvimarina pelagi HTCC2506]|uniref:Uncharacterized protein n=1 Tax=Fulvimarina pelagi HTCC2506 TaxID=314231 RepID=Q0G7M9_9HYPH|nr:hypothetical protein FP2506_05836 [Fulvimarina pelagi HTCC2506]